METTSDDLAILERAVGVFTAKLDSVRAYMVSYGIPWEPHMKKLDVESESANRALRNVMRDWCNANLKEGEDNENKKRLRK